MCLQLFLSANICDILYIYTRICYCKIFVFAVVVCRNLFLTLTLLVCILTLLIYIHILLLPACMFVFVVICLLYIFTCLLRPTANTRPVADCLLHLRCHLCVGGYLLHGLRHRTSSGVGLWGARHHHSRTQRTRTRTRTPRDRLLPGQGKGLNGLPSQRSRMALFEKIFRGQYYYPICLDWILIHLALVTWLIKRLLSLIYCFTAAHLRLTTPSACHLSWAVPYTFHQLHELSTVPIKCPVKWHSHTYTHIYIHMYTHAHNRPFHTTDHVYT